jgi:uncharacterized protein (DUF305 family)
VSVMHISSGNFSWCLRWLLLTPVLALVVSLVSLSPASASGPAPDKAVALFEGGFLLHMIDHHAMAVEMGEMCIEKAVHEDLQNLCEEISKTQGVEIETMQDWLEDWYGVRYEPQLTPSEMHQMEHLTSLSGSKFEITLMRELVLHHTIAIQNAERCVDRAHHGDLRTLCEEIIKTQQAEIEQLQTWLCEWYDWCHRKHEEGHS